MKFAINAAPFLTAAVMDLLDGHAYADVDFVTGNETTGFFLVNTTKKTFKHRPSTTRTVYNPATQFAEIVALVEGSVTTAPAAPAPVAAFAVGDRVTAVNTSKTKAKFRLQEGHVYTVDRITAKGNLGLAGLPNDEYLAKRFTKAAETNSSTSASTNTTEAVAVDADGNYLAVGDTVLVTVPTRRDGRFSLEADAVLTISEITAKGNIGFGGADQYLPKRVVKVDLVDAVDEDGDLNVSSGDSVICVRDGKHSRSAGNVSKFALPLNKLLTFRGVTVDKGNFILDGYTEHQYSGARFKAVVRD